MIRENDAGRASGLHNLPGRREFSGLIVNSEDDNGITVFVRRVEQASAWIEREEARFLAPGRLPGNRVERPCIWVDGESCYAIVSAVRYVNKIARRCNGNLGRFVVAGECGRYRGGHLERPKLATFAIPVIRGYGGIEFIENIGERPGRMEGYMTRRCSIAALYGRRVICHELAACSIKPINMDLVNAMVRSHDKTASRIE